MKHSVDEIIVEPSDNYYDNNLKIRSLVDWSHSPENMVKNRKPVELNQSRNSFFENAHNYTFFNKHTA